MKVTHNAKNSNITQGQASEVYEYEEGDCLLRNLNRG